MATILTSGRRNNTRNTAPVETSEFDGCWLNMGPMASDSEGNEKFVRIQRGVAVSDLSVRKVYENMDSDFAAEVTLINQIVTLIQKRCKTLEEGEMVPVDLKVFLYRRQEGVESSPVVENKELESLLFGS